MNATKWFLRDHCTFRYRGYYYDTETGYYYLQSRYYNPTWGRFLNADGYINANGDLIGFNMFAYCSNNPVMFVDYTGSTALTIKYSLNSYHACLEMGDSGGLGGGFAYGYSMLKIVEYTAVITGTISTFISSIFSSFEADKAKEEEKVYTDPPPNKGITYYHSTTLENAHLIIESGMLKGSSWEGGYVFAWKIKPTKKAIKLSGAHSGVIISFKTNAIFVSDPGITDTYVVGFMPVRSFYPGPIQIWDVKIEE